MGSHEHLRKFKMTLDLTQAAPKVVFSRISNNVFDSNISIVETIEDERRSSATTENSEL